MTDYKPHTSIKHQKRGLWLLAFFVVIGAIGYFALFV